MGCWCAGRTNKLCDFIEVIHNLLKATDAVVESSNDLVAVATRNCANKVHDTALKLDELLFPFFHSISPVRAHPMLQWLTHSFDISRSIIDRADAGNGTRSVIEKALNHVRRNTHFGQPSGKTYAVDRDSSNHQLRLIC
jgi:hypothetical protein